MGLYETYKAAKLGNAQLISQAANQKGQQIADERLKSAQIQQELEANQERDSMAREDRAREVGRNEGALSIMETVAPGSTASNTGLGLGSDTLESMGQLDQTHNDVMMEDAMAAIAQIEAAQAEGAPEEAIVQMINSVPEELHGAIREIKEAEALKAQQTQQVAPEQNATMPQKRENEITNYAKSLLQ